MMNTKFGFLGLMMMSTVMFTACSQDEAVGSADDAGKVVTTQLTSGVQTVPLVVTKGTTAVTVEYTSNGKKEQVSAPFTQTSENANSAMVSGYVLIYSPTATSVTIYNGDEAVAENVALDGPTVETSGTSTKANAYFYVRNDGTIPDEGAEKATKYFPLDNNGKSLMSTVNAAEIETDLTKVSPELTWKNDNGKNGTYEYMYSTDGSATEGIIFKEAPSYFIGENFKALLTKLGISGNPDDYKIIWYVVKKQKDGWHVDGAVVKKGTTDVDVTIPDDKNVRVSHVVKPDEDNNVGEGLYHNGGVMLYDGDGDKDYNDLVVDYDVEARLPKAGNTYKTPYIKVVMNLRALGAVNLDSVSLNLDGLRDYICVNDDTYITFQGVNKDKTPCTVDKWAIPDFSGSNCGLTAKVSGNTIISAGNLQWILNNGNASGWYKLDPNGLYNETQADFNAKPFATLTVMLYPKEGTEAMTAEQIEATINKIMDVAENSFTFNGLKGDYYIAPVGTPHVAEGNKITDVYKNFPDVTKKWWDVSDTNNYDCTKAVDPNKSYK